MKMHVGFRLAYFWILPQPITKINLAVETVYRQIFWPSCYFWQQNNHFKSLLISCRFFSNPTAVSSVLPPLFCLLKRYLNCPLRHRYRVVISLLRRNNSHRLFCFQMNGDTPGTSALKPSLSPVFFLRLLHAGGNYTSETPFDISSVHRSAISFRCPIVDAVHVTWNR